MGVVPEILQQTMNDLLHGFEFMCACIDNLLVLTKGDWTDHVQKLELTPNKLKEKVIKYNIEESLFGKTKKEYLGLWVTHDDVKPIHKNIESITNMAPPTPQK